MRHKKPQPPTPPQPGSGSPALGEAAGAEPDAQSQPTGVVVGKASSLRAAPGKPALSGAA